MGLKFEREEEANKEKEKEAKKEKEVMKNDRKVDDGWKEVGGRGAGSEKEFI